ncbi:MAG: hypothetical protein NW208_03530 [Bryobacter sp.]|nr:hypothetical protein [Bryobacter sp.]
MKNSSTICEKFGCLGALRLHGMMNNDEIRGAIRLAIATIKQQAAGHPVAHPNKVCDKLEEALLSLRMAKAGAALGRDRD